MTVIARFTAPLLCAAVAATVGLSVATAGPAVATPDSTTTGGSTDSTPPSGIHGLPAVARAVDGSVVPIRGGLPALLRTVDGSVVPVPVRGGLEGLIDQIERR
jgi:hypothetical protein